MEKAIINNDLHRLTEQMITAKYYDSDITEMVWLLKELKKNRNP